MQGASWRERERGRGRQPIQGQPVQGPHAREAYFAVPRSELELLHTQMASPGTFSQCVLQSGCSTLQYCIVSRTWIPSSGELGVEVRLCLPIKKCPHRTPWAPYVRACVCGCLRCLLIEANMKVQLALCLSKVYFNISPCEQQAVSLLRTHATHSCLAR